MVILVSPIVRGKRRKSAPFCAKVCNEASASGNWDPASGGTGWSNGHGFTSASASASGSYSYGLTLPPSTATSGSAVTTTNSASASGSVQGTISGAFGSETYSVGYSDTAALPSGSSVWTESGTGSASASSDYNYSYSGSGSGTVPDAENLAGTQWNISSESGSGSGSGSYSASIAVDGGVWSVTPTYSANSTQEDAYAYSTSGGGVNASGSEDAIVNTATSGWGEGSTSTTYSGSGSMTAYGGTNSWAPSTDGTGVELNGGTPPLGTVPDLWSLAGSEGLPGPQPGEEGVYVNIVEATQMTTGGVDLPGDPSDSGHAALPAAPDPGGLSPVMPAMWSSALPADTTVSYTAGMPAPPAAVSCIVTRSGTASSLQGLAQPPSALDALFAMWSGADPGYRGNNFSATANDLVQTRLAADNNPSLLPAFTTEEVLGAARVFTPSNVAVAMPVTDASNIVDYGFRGVSAAPLTTVVSLPASSADPWTLGPDPVLDPMTSVVKVCFPAGTPIFMPDGTVKLVEQIAKRDGVNAASDRNPEGPISTGEVVEVIRNGPSALIAVEFAGRVIKATPRHPFYVFGRGFIPAEELAPGDLLRAASGAKLAVTSVTAGGHAETSVQLPGPRPAYLLRRRFRRNGGAGA